MNEERLSHWFSSANDITSRLAETVEMLDDITRLTSDWVWSLDADLRLNFISERIFDNCGIPPDHALGKTLHELGTFVGDGDNGQPPNYQKPFRDKPFQLTSRDGLAHHLLVSALPVFSYETGQFTGVRGIVRDITEKTQAEGEFERLGSAMEEMSEVFILTDHDDRLVFVNREARIVNDVGEEYLNPGTPFSNFVTAMAHSGDVSEAIGREEAWIAERLERHRNPGRPFEIRRENGNHFLVHDERLPDGSTATFSLDISERKQMERALQESIKRQHEFASDVAHELRTPLAVLRANLDNLERSDTIESLKTDVSNISRVVEELLTESRVDDLEIVMDERADLMAIAKSVAANVAPLAIRRNRLIEVTGINEPTLVWGRTQALEQAVRNLVENAIEHSDMDTTVTIKVTESPAIYVIDRGAGIPDENKQTVFTHHLRADRRGSVRSGLGVVRRIADAHGATVGVNDAPEGGAVFYIRFPSFNEIDSPE